MISDAKPREIARIAGVVETLRVRPREGVSAIEAAVSDGTGTVTAVWLGRRTIPGLQLGVRMVLRGRLGGGAENLQLMNPEYEFAAPPEHQ
ncbi:MAG: OB-fold nucleic acid binding domain-containing protein [Actinomycetota bacterium]